MCDQGWVCEDHPDHPIDHALAEGSECGVAGMLYRLDGLYGKHNFLESTAVQVYFGIVDEAVAQRISTRLGKRTVRRQRVTKGRGGTTRSVDEVRESLLDVSEVLHLADEQLIVFANKAQLLVD